MVLDVKLDLDLVTFTGGKIFEMLSLSKIAILISTIGLSRTLKLFPETKNG